MTSTTPTNPSNDSRMPIVALLAMVAAVGGAALIGSAAEALGVHTAKSIDGRLFDEIERGDDHIGCVELAHQLLTGSGDVAIVDLRQRPAFQEWSLPGAVHMTLPELLGPQGDAVFAANPRLVVLCSSGTAHPAQAWVELRRRGRGNVKVLDGGLDAFRAEILKPPSLRPGSAIEPDGRAVAFHRMGESAFTPVGDPSASSEWAKDPETLTEPCMVSGAWVAARMGSLAILDVRPAVEFDLLHVPGSVRLDVETLRTSAGSGEPKLLRPDAELAAAFGALGVADTTPVVIVTGEKTQDATLAALALLRIEHRAVALLEGGFFQWLGQHRPATAERVTPKPAVHGVGIPGDDFTIGLDQMAAGVAKDALRVVDVRTRLEFDGNDPRDSKRVGHVPSARWVDAETGLVVRGNWWRWQRRARLAAAFEGGASEAPLVVMCHSGHRASAAFFAARFLLGHSSAKWFEGSWLEWAGRADLPVEK